LQRATKYTTEPPTRIKNSMVTLYRETDDMSFNACKKPTQYRRLTWALNFFHSILWCRRKYGHLGWTSSYSFNHVDHSITMEKLRQYLNISEDRNESVPYKDLLALTAEVYYGGHVSNPRDLQVLKFILADFFNPLIMEEKYTFTSKEVYHLPADGGIAIDSYLNQLPLFDDPEVLGFNETVKSLRNYYEGKVFFSSFQRMFSLRTTYSKSDVVEKIHSKVFMYRDLIYRT
jgi:dynein heavy chain